MAWTLGLASRKHACSASSHESLPDRPSQYLSSLSEQVLSLIEGRVNRQGLAHPSLRCTIWDLPLYGKAC